MSEMKQKRDGVPVPERRAWAGLPLTRRTSAEVVLVMVVLALMVRFEGLTLSVKSFLPVVGVWLVFAVVYHAVREATDWMLERSWRVIDQGPAKRPGLVASLLSFVAFGALILPPTLSLVAVGAATRAAGAEVRVSPLGLVVVVAVLSVTRLAYGWMVTRHDTAETDDDICPEESEGESRVAETGR